MMMSIDSPMEMKWDPILRQTQIQEDPRDPRPSKKKEQHPFFGYGTMLYVKVMGESMNAFPNL